ncbi:MAG: 2-phosphosulfolactate phosphatase [Candidatus Zixiibacteriota bacterium]|nr:MAG: 2-phosphosulfolactate phosphatase [candidate division Zixibacteria bacterium]
MEKKVVIDCFQEGTFRYRNEYAIVVVDVMRATTTAATAVSMGRRVLPARTTDEAFVIASTLEDPLLVGELGGNMPYGFHLTNSPVQVAARDDIKRPMILVSSSGTALLMSSAGSQGVFAACFRNYSAMARYLSEKFDKIAIVGAGTRGQFRKEDQMCCAWVAELLVKDGFRAETPQTREYIYRWSGQSAEEARVGESADYLRNSGQEDDLEFILSHVDDLDTVVGLVNYELKALNQC